RGGLHFHNDCRLRAETDEIFERKCVDSISNDLGERRLEDAEAPGSTHLHQPVAIDPHPQRVAQLTSKEPHRRCVWLTTEVEDDVSATSRHRSIDSRLHDSTPIRA